MFHASLHSKCGTHLMQEINPFLTTSQSFLDLQFSGFPPFLPLCTVSSLSPYRIKTDEELGEGV